MMRGPIQKCPELAPASPLGANDGRAKWASGAVIGGSVRSLTTPSSDEAQAERRQASARHSITDRTALFFTKQNLQIEKSGATAGHEG
jgi:hypothetical protein